MCNSSSEFDFAFILGIYNKCHEDLTKSLFIKEFLYPEVQKLFKSTFCKEQVEKVQFQAN